MSIWVMLGMALGTLWLQALVIQLSALHALREELRACWEAFVGLERLCFARVRELARDARGSGVESSPVSESSDAGLRALLEGRVLPEDPAAPVVFEEAGRRLEAALPAIRAALGAEAARLGRFAQAEASGRKVPRAKKEAGLASTTSAESAIDLDF